MKIKVSELTGAALDWAVALIERPDWKAEGYLEVFPDDLSFDDGTVYAPSTDWAHGGPIIEREKIRIAYNFDEHIWEAGWDCHVKGWGDTPLIAAMRAYVASQLGDEVVLLESEV